MLVKYQLLISLLFTSLIGFVAAWSDQDLEIFALREQVEKDLGKGATFYDWLDVPQYAKDEQIAKAYRKLSRQLHPDKNSHRSSTEKYTRLSLIVNILRSESRERYDFFLSKGFPRWKGTGYYYNRYRPGLGTVLVFLYLFISGAQYLLMKISSDRDRAHMSNVIDEAKRLAWSGSTTPGVNMSSKRRVTLPNGKIFTVYPSGDVFIVDHDVEFHLNLDDIKSPTWKDTILYKLPIWIRALITGQQAEFNEPEGHKLSDPEPPKKKTPRPATKVAGRRK
ncbi:Erj5p [Sugiyamaella lignohabitans]|uniref:Erj5p n=1 Tax=Sugiyamaella lignohabitans TaxID=796027 RepID=A0A161HM95_9ASCO|nr:Erj5p [Sugiyamaella lignohabitans]ANB14747.1 Erj5p [Sugiyamaella lignohabitans]